VATRSVFSSASAGLITGERAAREQPSTRFTFSTGFLSARRLSTPPRCAPALAPRSYMGAYDDTCGSLLQGKASKGKGSSDAPPSPMRLQFRRIGLDGSPVGCEAGSAGEAGSFHTLDLSNVPRRGQTSPCPDPVSSALELVYCAEGDAKKKKKKGAEVNRNVEGFPRALPLARLLTGVRRLTRRIARSMWTRPQSAPPLAGPRMRSDS
jgi:hypothetical protein